MASDTSGDILFERCGALGLITLNRPAAMNALTHDMALRLEGRLDLWAEDDAVAVVAIQGAGERAFCAGGDIRALYDAGRRDGRANFRFYADEYRLNAKIRRFPKPYVAIMDGIVMGGGVGVSIHGSHRIATERTTFAMPETGIGLFPDVGATHFLPRLAGETGLWLGLTGARLRGDNAVRAGLCDFFLPSERIEQQLERLAQTGGRDLDLSAPAGPGLVEHRAPGLEHQGEIDALFKGASVEALLADLTVSGRDWGARTAAAIGAKSPTCTRIAFRQIRAGAEMGFEDCMRLEYRLARFCMTHPDFYEGVRALIIDKDNTPIWSPADLAEATDAYVAPAFEPLGAEELSLT